MDGWAGNARQALSPRPAQVQLTGTPAVQVFGRRDSRETRHALRFFRERRVPLSFVDFAVRAPAAAELRRFSQRFGAAALLDVDGRAYREAGLAYMRLDEGEILGRVLAEPRLLRLPLVRLGADLAVGPDEAAWRDLLARVMA